MGLLFFINTVTALLINMQLKKYKMLKNNIVLPDMVVRQKDHKFKPSLRNSISQTWTT
jgi:hypothetical protein